MTEVRGEGYRLIRGDCLEVLEALKGEGVQVDAVITDPPYGIKIKSQNPFSNAKKLEVKTTSWDDVAPVQYLDSSLQLLRPGGFFLAFTDQKFAGDLWNRAKEADLKWVRWFYWIKTNPCPHALPTYCNAVEVAVVGSKGGEKPVFNGGFASPNYFQTGLASGKERTPHPTQKNLDLMRKLIRDLVPEGGTVLDPFGGSGTTAVAAMLEGRESISIERDAEYFEIMRKRLQGWYDSDTMRQMKLI